MGKLQAFDNLNFETITANKPEYKQIEWNLIDSNTELNIREKEKYEQDPELHELAYSIIQFGLRQPIVLYRDKQKRNSYKIWHGQRRYSAIKLIQTVEEINYHYEIEPHKITKQNKESTFRIPCIILPEPEDSTERILRQIAENEHRKDVDNLELAKQYNSLLKDNPTWTQDMLSEKVGKSKQLISDICGLKRITPEIQKLLSEIQLYGTTCKKGEIEQLNLFNQYDPSYSKKIGIKILRKIAASDNQANAFWEIFGSKSTDEDAKFIGYIKPEIDKKQNKDEIKEFSNEYLKLSKKTSEVDGKAKEKYEKKKLELAKKLIIKLMEENKLSTKDL
ncbi:MAG: ParB/RepB/Spo0J family partition protein [Candidatus Sericytochromatia bacterium]